jgi:hypothetical protein
VARMLEPYVIVIAAFGILAIVALVLLVKSLK